MQGSSYSTPGIYQVDVLPAPQPRLDVGVPVLLGFTQTAPGGAGALLEITSTDGFTRLYGQLARPGFLSAAVDGFFRNGGRRCRIVSLGGQKDRDQLGSGARPATRLIPPLEQALDRLLREEGVDLICAPDLSLVASDYDALIQLQQRILAHCAEAGDRFAILDARPPARLSVAQDLEAATDQAAALGRSRGAESAALYFPWLVDGGGRQLPPSGHLAGVYAAGDQTIGPHHSPANVELEGVYDLTLDVTDARQAPLNAQGVNAIRAFPGRGLRPWGARTLSPGGAWIGVRRLVLTLGRWLRFTFDDLTFEPHDVRLWMRINRQVAAFLGELHASGALVGQTPEEAFFVRCDEETNPPSVREAGQLVAEIGIAPVTPGEFIVIRLIQGEAGASVDLSAPSP